MLPVPDTGMCLAVAGRTYSCRECGTTILKGDQVVEVPVGAWNNCVKVVKVCLTCGAQAAAEAVANARRFQVKVMTANAGQAQDDAAPCSECATPVDVGGPFYGTPCGTFCGECMGAHMEGCGVCAREFEFL